MKNQGTCPTYDLEDHMKHNSQKINFMKKQAISFNDQPPGDSTTDDNSTSHPSTGGSTMHNNCEIDLSIGGSTEHKSDGKDKSMEGNINHAYSNSLDNLSKQNPSKRDNNSSDQPKDVSRCKISYGWVIVAAEFLLFFVTGCLLESQAMFYPAFREAFDVNFEKVGWFISLAKFTQALTSLLCGSIVDSYGSRNVCLVGCLLQGLGMLISSFSPNIYLLFITYSLIWGPGLGLIYTSAPVIIQKWFTKNRSLAHSLSINGIPCGVIASGPLTYALLETYGWRGGLLVYSAIGLNGLVSAALMRPPPVTNTLEIKAATNKTVKRSNDEKKKSYSDTIENKDDKRLNNCYGTTSGFCKRLLHLVTKLIDISLLKNPIFVLFFLARSLANYGYQTSRIHIPSRALVLGMPKDQVQYLPIFAGVSSAMGTITSGVAGRQLDLASLTGIGMSLHGIFQITIGFTGKDFIWNAVSTSVSNFMIGVFLSLEPTLMADIVGVHRLGRAYGLYSLVVSVSALTAAPFSGWMYDISGNYNIPFYVTGALAVVAGMLMGVTVYLSKRRKPKYVSECTNVNLDSLSA